MTTLQSCSLLAAATLMVLPAVGYPQSTAPEDQTLSGEYQGVLESSDGSTATFYIQTAISPDSAGVGRAALAGVFGYVHGQREIVVTGVELRAGDAVYRPGMAPRTVIRGQGDFQGGGAVVASVGVISDLFRDPQSVEVRVLTEDAPQGLFSGRLKRARLTYLAAFTQGSGASGWDVVLASATRNAAGRIDSAMIQSQISSIRGLALAPVRGVYPWRVSVHEADSTLIDFGSPSDATASAGGYPGTIMYGIDTRDGGRLEMFERLVANPSGFELRLTAASGTVLSGAVRKMDRAVFSPRRGGADGAVAYVEADFTREADGTVSSGVLFNITDWSTAAIRGAVQSVRIHAGAEGETGPALLDLVTAQTGAPVGRFLIGAAVIPPTDFAARAAIDRLIHYPDLVYMNAVSAGDAAGVRVQMIASPGTPVIESITPSTLVSGGFAPGSLMTIRGKGLAKVTSGVGDWARTRVPDALNGAVVEVGGRRAAILFVSPTQINAQVPFEAAGSAAVAVNHGTGVSEVRTIAVGVRAPSLFPGFQAADGIVTVYGSGFGQTSPALESGSIVPAGGEFRVPGVTATVGGQAAEVIDAMALPGLPGLYRVRVRTGGMSGALVIRAGGAESNAVMLTSR